MVIKVNKVKGNICEFAAGITLGKEYDVTDLCMSLGELHFVFTDDNGNKR